MRSFLAGIAFLTRVPVGTRTGFSEADVARSSAWFPFIGLLLGLFYSLAAFFLKAHLPVSVVAVLLIILDILTTGGLHFDGLADTADGFGGGKTAEDVLRIMRDHAIGAYGGIALATLVLLKAASYAALLTRTGWAQSIIFTPAIGRWSILLLTATLPYARPSQSPIAGMGKRSLIWGTITMMAAAAAARSTRIWIVLAAVLAVSAAFGFYCRGRIAGITGDTLGANLQLCESATLLTFLWIGPAQ